MDTAQVTILALLVAAVPAAVLSRLEQPKWQKLTDQDDYDVHKFSPDRPPGFHNNSIDGVVPTTGTTFTAYVAQLTAGLPDTFGFQLPTGGTLYAVACAYAALVV